MTESLLGLTAEMQRLEFILARLEDDEEAAMADVERWLTELGEDWQRKVDGYVMVYRARMARAKARKDEARHLQEMARADENVAKQLKERVKVAARVLDRKKLEGLKRTITISSGGFSVNVTSEEILPTSFWRVIPETRAPDKKAIKAHVKKTGEIPAGVVTVPTVRVLFR